MHASERLAKRLAMYISSHPLSRLFRSSYATIAPTSSQCSVHVACRLLAACASWTAARNVVSFGPRHGRYDAHGKRCTISILRLSHFLFLSAFRRPGGRRPESEGKRKSEKAKRRKGKRDAEALSSAARRKYATKREGEAAGRCPVPSNLMLFRSSNHASACCTRANAC